MLKAWWPTTVEIADGEFAELKAGIIVPEALEPYSFEENGVRVVQYDRLRDWLATRGR